MKHVEGRIIDYRKLKETFSNNRKEMEQVMQGLILTAHEKTPALKRYYVVENWEELNNTIRFIQSVFKHVSTERLDEVLNRLYKLEERKKTSKELNDAIEEIADLSSNIIQDIEYYLVEGK
ncbi:MAG: hypothetical protein OEW67_03665 [Cyclobacteriaceae bacterium]|nr:hypothetical protein [Cyclobacteriaceae bacterium]